MIYSSWKSAKNRSQFSRPAVMCNELGLIVGDRILDYGCGRGGDVSRWSDMGYQSVGFDPYWSPELPSSGDRFPTVTLFYVLNVIPRVLERIHALSNAWSFCSERLIVANMTGGATLISGDRYFAEMSTWDIKRLIIYVCRKVPRFVSSGIYFVDRSSPDIPLYSWSEAIEAIDRIKESQPIANDGDYLSCDRGRTIYYCGGNKLRRFNVRDRDLDKYRESIDRRDRIRLIQLCTF